jgi:hypothetical protein
MLTQSQHFHVIPTAFVVAYQSATGGWVGVTEHASAVSAEQEARRLNAERARKKHSTPGTSNASSANPRRTARSVEPDAFA